MIDGSFLINLNVCIKDSVFRHALFCCDQMIAWQQGSAFFLHGEIVFCASGVKKKKNFSLGNSKETTLPQLLVKVKRELQFWKDWSSKMIKGFIRLITDSLWIHLDESWLISNFLASINLMREGNLHWKTFFLILFAFNYQTDTVYRYENKNEIAPLDRPFTDLWQWVDLLSATTSLGAVWLHIKIADVLPILWVFAPQPCWHAILRWKRSLQSVLATVCPLVVSSRCFFCFVLFPS